MKADEAEILVATSSAVFREGTSTYRIVAGKTTARRGAAIVRGREHLFTPLVVDFDIDGPTPPHMKKRGRPRKSDTVETFPVETPTVEAQPEPEPAPTPEPAPPMTLEEKRALQTKDLPPKENT